MEALAAEVGHLGIRVTLIEPGPVRSLWIPSGAKNEEIMPDYQAVKLDMDFNAVGWRLMDTEWRSLVGNIVERWVGGAARYASA